MVCRFWRWKGLDGWRMVLWVGGHVFFMDCAVEMCITTFIVAWWVYKFSLLSIVVIQLDMMRVMMLNKLHKIKIAK